MHGIEPSRVKYSEVESLYSVVECHRVQCNQVGPFPSVVESSRHK